MVVNRRADEAQWLRYAPDESVGTMRAAEAWALRIAGEYLRRLGQSMSSEGRQHAFHAGEILKRISDARMDYLGSGRYDVPLESAIGASAFDTISRVIAGEPVRPEVVDEALSLIASSLHHLEERGRAAGFMSPVRLESILLRGD